MLKRSKICVCNFVEANNTECYQRGAISWPSSQQQVPVNKLYDQGRRPTDSSRTCNILLFTEDSLKELLVPKPA